MWKSRFIKMLPILSCLIYLGGCDLFTSPDSASNFPEEDGTQGQVVYDGIVVGDYVADLIVNGCVIVELKAVKAFDNVHYAQCLNYLKATGMKACLLINFGVPRIQIKRFLN